jgi:hypothetical protein
VPRAWALWEEEEEVVVVDGRSVLCMPLQTCPGYLPSGNLAPEKAARASGAWRVVAQAAMGKRKKGVWN